MTMVGSFVIHRQKNALISASIEMNARDQSAMRCNRVTTESNPVTFVGRASSLQESSRSLDHFRETAAPTADGLRENSRRAVPVHADPAAEPAGAAGALAETRGIVSIHDHRSRPTIGSSPVRRDLSAESFVALPPKKRYEVVQHTFRDERPSPNEQTHPNAQTKIGSDGNRGLMVETRDVRTIDSVIVTHA